MCLCITITYTSVEFILLMNEPGSKLSEILKVRAFTASFQTVNGKKGVQPEVCKSRIRLSVMSVSDIISFFEYY